MDPRGQAGAPSGPETRYVVGVVMVVLGGVGLLGSLVFVLVGGIFAAVFPAVFGMPFDDLELDRGAARSVGEVLSVGPNPGLTVNNQTTVRIRYRYDPSGGPREGDVVVVQSHEMARLRPGASVMVEHLPSDPSVSRIEGTRAEVAGWAGVIGYGFGAVGLVLVVACLVLVVVGIVVARRARRRQRVGVPR